MKATVRVFVLLALFAGPFVLASPGDPPTNAPPDKPKKDDGKIKDLMKAKLAHSQKILEALALNDYKAMAKNGQALIALSARAEWRVFPSPEYSMYSNEFQRAAESLVKKAREENQDGATLAYLELTMNCVRCHKYVREIRMTRLEPPGHRPTGSVAGAPGARVETRGPLAR
jgi:hypothetical protein